MTQSEYIKMYCERSIVTESLLNDHKIASFFCDCGEKECEGWAMISKVGLKAHWDLIYA